MKTRLVTFYFTAFALVRLTPADTAEDLNAAVRPLLNGVPQVAVVRLRALLAQRLSGEEKNTAQLKLAEALIESGQPNESLPVLDEPAIRETPEAKFFRAQAFAALSRWSEALPFYDELATNAGAPFHTEAMLGRADSLRALGRTDEALRAYNLLASDEHWRVRAHLRMAELLLARNDPGGAMRELNSVDAKSAGDRRERRFLRACVEMQLGNKKRATKLFASILKSPRGATRSVLLATLFGVAETHLRANTPESGDDFLEDFIEHHPDDEALSVIFAKLDKLYVAERRQSRHELGRWARDPAQPRRAFAAVILLERVLDEFVQLLAELVQPRLAVE
jgi:thioredoxin-like negative regulator of GroEL